MLPWITKASSAAPAKVRNVNSRMINMNAMVSRLIFLESPV